MVQVYEEPISRRHYAPYFSVAFLYRPLCVGREIKNGGKFWCTQKKAMLKSHPILRPTPSERRSRHTQHPYLTGTSTLFSPLLPCQTSTSTHTAGPPPFSHFKAQVFLLFF